MSYTLYILIGAGTSLANIMEKEDNVDLVLGMVGVAVWLALQVALQMVVVRLLGRVLGGYVFLLPPPF